MSAPIRLRLPLTADAIASMRSGASLLLSGVIYTGRDAAHKRLYDLLQAGQELPIDLRDQTIYYVGPTPAKPGRVIGSAGPTTSGRMDAYTPALIAAGMKGMIGKGLRSPEVLAAIREYNAVYFGATGGAGALLAKRIVKAEVVAYPDLGPEAIHRLEVEDFPVIVINDAHGGDLYHDGVREYERSTKKQG